MQNLSLSRSFQDHYSSTMSSSPALKPTTTTPPSATSGSDFSFQRQVTATRAALSNFSVIASLNAPGPALLAMEELINVTVRGTHNFIFALLTFSGIFRSTSPDLFLPMSPQMSSRNSRFWFFRSSTLLLSSTRISSTRLTFHVSSP
jgi:hypothetical protein